MSKIKDIFLENIIPGLGVLVASFLFGSPMRAVLRVRRTQDIGELNILPFIMMAFNCAAWIAYACATVDIYLLVGNFIGMLMGFFYLVSTYHLAAPKVRDHVSMIFVGTAGMFAILAYMTTTGPLDSASAPKTTWGITANVILLAFYASPLSTMYHVIASRDSASILPPLSVLSVLNGSLWVAYGFAINAPFVWAPNAFGVVTGTVQLILCAIFPRQPRLTKVDSGSTRALKTSTSGVV